MTGNRVEDKQCNYSLRKAIKQAKRQYRESGVAIQRLRHKTYGAGATAITDYKRKTSHVGDTVLIPDKLNTFFTRFENNTVPPTQPVPKDCGLSISVGKVSKTFKSVNPRKA